VEGRGSSLGRPSRLQLKGNRKRRWRSGPRFVTTIVTTASAVDIHIVPDGPHTPVVFSREEVREIREALGTGAKARCSHCSSALVVRGPVARGGTQGMVWHVRCDGCRRVAFIREVPRSHRARKTGSGQRDRQD
jgi:hypothetical protein